MFTQLLTFHSPMKIMIEIIGRSVSKDFSWIGGVLGWVFKRFFFTFLIPKKWGNDPTLTTFLKPVATTHGFELVFPLNGTVRRNDLPPYAACQITWGSPSAPVSILEPRGMKRPQLRSPQKVGKSKGILPKMTETFRWRIYNVPRCISL